MRERQNKAARARNAAARFANMSMVAHSSISRCMRDKEMIWPFHKQWILENVSKGAASRQQAVHLGWRLP